LLPDMSDEDLIQQFIQGDNQAFNTLYDRHVKTVFKRVGYRIPETDVEDVTQEVFLALLGSLSSYRGNAKFKTWLYALTNHKIAEFYRKQSRKKETIQVDLDHAEQRSADNNMVPPDDQIILQNALNKIHKDYREVILLRYADELQFSEIAAQLNKSLEGTKSLFRRAMSDLQEELDGRNDQSAK
jgi:RNA polymerase sigma-70 factor, ECF subfamily